MRALLPFVLCLIVTQGRACLNPERHLCCDGAACYGDCVCGAGEWPVACEGSTPWDEGKPFPPKYPEWPDG